MHNNLLGTCHVDIYCCDICKVCFILLVFQRRFLERLLLAVLHLACLSVAIYTRPNDKNLLGYTDRVNIVRSMDKTAFMSVPLGNGALIIQIVHMYVY